MQRSNQWLRALVAVTCLLLSACDLELTKTGPAAAIVGERITWTIRIRNLMSGTNGCNRDNVTVTDLLPSTVQFVAATPSQGNCTGPAGSTLTCALGTVSLLGQATITIEAIATTAGRITNSATVAGDQCSGFGDPNPDNDTDTFVTVVHAGTEAPAVSLPGLLLLAATLLVVGRRLLGRVITR